MSLSRKHFISATALGLTAAAVAPSASRAAQGGYEQIPIHFHVVKPDEYDNAAMMQTLTDANPHKQVFQSTGPLIVAGWASLYLHMQNSMNAYQFSLGLGRLATLGVCLGPSVVFGLNDAMWIKYGLGKMSKDLAPTNVYYKAHSKLDASAEPDDPAGMYQDWSAQAVLARGGRFFVCHNALTAFAGLVAMMSKGDPKAVLADWEKNVLPGILIVPAGVAAVQQAIENGWKYFAII